MRKRAIPKNIQMKKRLIAFRSAYEEVRPVRHAMVRNESTDVVIHSYANTIKSFFLRYAVFAGMPYSGFQVMTVSLLAALIGFCIGIFLSIWAALLLFCLCFYLPLSYLRAKAEKRAKTFSAEYPSVLLAMASNMKAGLTVYSSLERAIALLPAESYVKREVRTFLEKISRGVSSEKAVQEFAQDIQLKELELFRRAFALVIVHGGKFSRTLERLAQVTRDRENLINSSRVSTASMRMTSNVLLVVAPFLLFILSAKNKDFWHVLLNNNIAYTLALIGTLTIGISVYALRRMSDFKP